MSAKRKTLSKKVRFDIFKRDEFQCQYCGMSPPNIVLEVDHIRPASKGGDNSEENLITACFDCNRGKAANDLSVAPETLVKKMQVLEEKNEQMKAYERMLRSRSADLTRKISRVESVFQNVYIDKGFTDSFKESVRSFLKKLPAPEVEEAMMVAVSRIDNPDGATKYFCGICWKMIRELENA